MEKKPRKVKVYGLDSTKAIRARLIEILQERVRYHKDKFIAPILYDEMRSMEVKKNGKVEHSDRTHDDQVFSYLMALYVWYDGKNLAENWQIRKNTLKTDDARELEENAFEDEIESNNTNVDFRSSTFEMDEEISKELEWVENDTFITSKQMQDNQYYENVNIRNKLASDNATDIDSMPLGVHVGGASALGQNYVDMSNCILDLDDDYSIDNYTTANGTPLAGNLAELYNKV